MHQLGERFGKAVGKGLGHDGIVVVVVALEARPARFDVNPAGDGEGAKIVGKSRLLGRNEVGESQIVVARGLVHLLAQRMENGQNG